MLTGTVLSKVNKLTGSDSFSVQTQSAACGVRGTQFMVSAGGDDDTLLAVKEGSVVIVPSKFDLEALLSRIPSDSNDIYNAVKNIGNSVTVVDADQEIEIKGEDIARIENTYNDLEKAVTELENRKAGKADSDRIKSLSDMLIKELSAASALTDQHREEMEYLDTMVIRQLPEGGNNQVTDMLVKVTVSVDIPDAQIIRNSKVIARGGFSAIVNNGEEVSLLIRKRGYFDKELVFKADSKSSNSFDVVLEKGP